MGIELAGSAGCRTVRGLRSGPHSRPFRLCRNAECVSSCADAAGAVDCDGRRLSQIGAAPLVLVSGPVARAGLVTLAGVAAVGGTLIAFDLATGNRSHGCGCLGGGHGALSWWLPLRSAAVAGCAVALAAVVPSASALPLPAGALLLLGLTFGWAVLIAATRLRATSGERFET